MSDKNLASKGFTKYVKTGNGSYEKTAGDGPKKIKRRVRNAHGKQNRGIDDRRNRCRLRDLAVDKSR